MKDLPSGHSWEIVTIYNINFNYARICSKCKVTICYDKDKGWLLTNDSYIMFNIDYIPENCEETLMHEALS